MSQSEVAGSLNDVSHVLENNKDCLLNEGERTVCRSIILSLMLLATTDRPDLGVTATTLASHLHDIIKIDMVMAKPALC